MSWSHFLCAPPRIVNAEGRSEILTGDPPSLAQWFSLAFRNLIWHQSGGDEVFLALAEKGQQSPSGLISASERAGVPLFAKKRSWAMKELQCVSAKKSPTRGAGEHLISRPRIYEFLTLKVNSVFSRSLSTSYCFCNRTRFASASSFADLSFASWAKCSWAVCTNGAFIMKHPHIKQRAVYLFQTFPEDGHLSLLGKLRLHGRLHISVNHLILFSKL
jgi:hypothetical protein